MLHDGFRVAASHSADTLCRSDATRLKSDRQSVNFFETTAGGSRQSTSVGGVLTGFGADVIIVDVPTKPQEALSDKERATANRLGCDLRRVCPSRRAQYGRLSGCN